MPTRSRRPDSRPGLGSPRSSLISASPPAPYKARPGDVEWAVFRLRHKAQLIGHVQAKDQKEALARAVEELKIPEHERFRISVQRT